MLQRKSPRARDAGYVDEALNVAHIGGTIIGRPGLRPFNGVAFNGPVRGMGWHIQPDGTRQLLVAAGPTIQRCVKGGDPVDCPLTSLPTTERTRTEVEKVHFLSLSGGTNTTFIYDGVNTNLKWDGKVLTKMGLPNGPTPAVPVSQLGVPPATPADESDSTFNVDKGTRQYVITLLSPYHEGDISVVSRSVTSPGPGHKYTFASPVDGADDPANNKYDDPQVTQWRLWRTTAGGPDFFLVGTADIGSTITDNISDNRIRGGLLVEQLVNGPPVGPFVALVEHRGQLIGVTADDLSLLRFSNFDPEYEVPEGWPKNFVQPVAHGDGDDITALRSFNEWCMIFKENSTHALTGQTFTEYTVLPMLAGGTRAGIGTSFPGSILQIENSIFFAARDGIYRVNRFETQRTLTYGGVVATRMTTAIDDLYAAAKFSLGSATFFDRKRRVFVFLGHG